MSPIISYVKDDIQLLRSTTAFAPLFSCRVISPKCSTSCPTRRIRCHFQQSLIVVALKARSHTLLRDLCMAGTRMDTSEVGVPGATRLYQPNDVRSRELDKGGGRGFETIERKNTHIRPWLALRDPGWTGCSQPGWLTARLALFAHISL